MANHPLRRHSVWISDFWCCSCILIGAVFRWIFDFDRRDYIITEYDIEVGIPRFLEKRGDRL